ncbi:MAG: His/Gly/Thr/Pro-type tRNA ligase C-terminal domain-containing protein, partial [Chloroflexi bacterium]|nr:His/Gly/Thr/Pro-type tRNA ligase C-terminal domain-containing protein [Chloroflexota bacterium]
EDGREHRTVMIHRTVLGSMERFFACLTEHYAGAFPAWLAPIQVVLIPIADRHRDYADKIFKDLRSKDIRVQLDDRSERMNLKIREAQLNKIPYMLIVGDKELENSTVSVRLRTGEDLGSLGYADFENRIKTVIEARTLDKL